MNLNRFVDIQHAVLLKGTGKECLTFAQEAMNKKVKELDTDALLNRILMLGDYASASRFVTEVPGSDLDKVVNQLVLNLSTESPKYARLIMGSLDPVEPGNKAAILALDSIKYHSSSQSDWDFFVKCQDRLQDMKSTYTDSHNAWFLVSSSSGSSAPLSHGVSDEKHYIIMAPNKSLAVATGNYVASRSCSVSSLVCEGAYERGAYESVYSDDEWNGLKGLSWSDYEDTCGSSIRLSDLYYQDMEPYFFDDSYFDGLQLLNQYEEIPFNLFELLHSGNFLNEWRKEVSEDDVTQYCLQAIKEVTDDQSKVDDKAFALLSSVYGSCFDMQDQGDLLTPPILGLSKSLGNILHEITNDADVNNMEYSLSDLQDAVSKYQAYECPIDEDIEPDHNDDLLMQSV